MALVRRRLVHPEQASVAGEDGFRFHHALIRDSVYGAIDEQARRVCTSASGRALAAGDGAGDEVVGYHLEQAARVDPALAAEARVTAAGSRGRPRRCAASTRNPAIDLLTRAIPACRLGRGTARAQLRARHGREVLR